jgi:hypothetical protein
LGHPNCASELEELCNIEDNRHVKVIELINENRETTNVRINNYPIE